MAQKAKQQAKAYCFWVLPKDGNAEDLSEALRQFARKEKPLELISAIGRIQVTEAHWRKAGDSQVFTATAFRIRINGFPSVIGDEGPERLDIPDSTGLGEAACFAIDPVQGIAVVQFVQNGPRHSIIPSVLEKLGFPHEVQVEPVLRSDMIERLQRTRLVQSLDFKLRDVSAPSKLAEAGPPVEWAIALANAVDGADIQVKVSVGNRKKGLALDVVKRAMGFLHGLHSTQVEKLQLLASESEDRKCETLDLLNARIEIELDVAESFRALDREDCQRKLVAALKEVLPAIRKQKPS
jgi:hypothetical protein